jgi:hypothetical protein
MMIPTTKYLLLGALMLWLMSGVVACALKSHGVVRMQRGYDEAFAASLAAIQEAEFIVTSQNHATGTIMAEKRLPQAAGEVMQMTVRLTRAPTDITVVATVVAPASMLATGEKPCKCHVKRFVAALEQRMPDVQVVSIQ